MSNLFVYSRFTGSAEQAAPQASVLTMSHVARRKLSALVAEGHQVCGIMIERQNADGTVTRGAVSAGGMVIWWQPEQP